MKVTSLARFVPTLCALGALAATSGGCAAPTTGERVARDVKVVASERTPDQLLARGLGFAQVGDLTRAEQYLVAALDAGAPTDAVLPKLLVVCIANAHYRAGIEYAAPELQRNPENAPLRFVVAELQSLIGDTDGAKASLDEVTKERPSDAAPHFAYARLLRDSFGDMVGADREFRAYLDLEPRGEHALEARAYVLKTVPAAPPPAAPASPDAAPRPEEPKKL